MIPAPGRREKLVAMIRAGEQNKLHRQQNSLLVSGFACATGIMLMDWVAKKIEIRTKGDGNVTEGSATAITMNAGAVGLIWRRRIVVIDSTTRMSSGLTETSSHQQPHRAPCPHIIL